MSKKGQQPQVVVNPDPYFVPPFGSPLTKLPCTTSNGIPLIPVMIHSALNYLEQHGGLQLEGIFRISGSSANVQKLKAAFESGEKTIFTKGDDLYDVACLVKLFFRELPDPLCTFELYDCLIAATGFPEEHFTSAVQKIVDLLPPHNQNLLLYLSEFIQKVTVHEKVNKMGANNLAIVFAPNILRAKEESIETIVGDSQRAHTIVYNFFANFTDIFQKYKDKMVKDKNAMIARDEQKLKEFKEEMTKKYLTHRAETSLKINEEMASKTEDEFEQHMAEQVAKLSVGMIDDNNPNSEETWNQTEYKEVYNRTLRGFKNKKVRPTAVATLAPTQPTPEAKRSSGNGWLGRQRNDSETPTVVTSPEKSPDPDRKEFKINSKTPNDLSKLYFGGSKR